MRLYFNKISLKLLAVCLSFVLPIAVMLNIMIATNQKDIDFAVWEMKGDEYQRPLEWIMKGVAFHQWHSLRARLANTTFTAELNAAETQIAAELSRLLDVNSRLGAELQFTAEGLGKRKRAEFTAENLKAKWEKHVAGAATMTTTDLLASYANVITHLKTMITHAGDTSNLILDPDLDSYYLMDVTLLALPQAQDRLQNVITFVEKMVAQGQMTPDERLQAGVYAAFMREADIDRINGSTQTALNEDPNFYGVSDSLQKRVGDGVKANAAAVEPVIAALKDLAQIADVKTFALDDFRAKAKTALESLYAFHAVALDEEDNLLKMRLAVLDGKVTRAVVWTTISLLVSALLAFFITSSILKRLRRFNETTRLIAAGDMKARVQMKSADELGQLANSFDSMTDKIAKLNTEITTMNTDLEHTVAERTATIKTILDNVKFGFLLIDRDLKVEQGFSRSCTELLGNGLRPGQDFLQAFSLGESRHGPMASEFMKQAFEDMLPEELTLQQLPARIELGEKILSIIATCARDAKNQVKSILFTIIDATSLEHAERESHRHKVLVRLLKEMDSFKDLLEETRSRLEICRKFLKHDDQAKVRAELHTMKGNTAAYDIIDIAKLIHYVEDAPTIHESDIDRIEAAYVGFLEQNFDVLGLAWSAESQGSTFEISHDQISDVIDRVRSSAGLDARAVQVLSDWAATIKFKPARALIGALPDYGERLAMRLGKQVRVRVEGGEVRMNPEIMRPIMQSLVHVVRNAIDHGIESSDQRNGKDETGTVAILCTETEANWKIIVSDDGQGINARLLLEKAIKSGAVAKEKALKMTEREKYHLIFMNGVSTAESVSEISGRGVGMGAVEASVLEAGGSIDVESKIGQGTRVVITVPMEKAGMPGKKSAVAA